MDSKTHPFYNQSIVFLSQNTESDRKDADMNPQITFIIADDEQNICTGLTNIILQCDPRFSLIGCAGNGTEALSMITMHQPDFAVMDIRMPGMDGLEVIQKSVDSSPDTCFLILSGYDDFTYAQKAIRYGAKGYFLKPLDVPAFCNEIMRLSQTLVSEITKRDLQQQQEREEQLMTERIHFLNSFLHGEITNTSHAHQSFADLFPFLKNIPSCIVIYQLDYDDSFGEQELLSGIKERTDLLLTAYPHFIWVQDSHHILIILNLTNPFELLSETIRKAVGRISASEGLKLYAGIGSTVSSLQNTPVSYASAVSALSYNLYDTGLQVYDSSVICTKTPDFAVTDIHPEQLSSYILKNDMNGIHSFCEHFFKSLFYVSFPPPDFVRGMCVYLIVNIQKEFSSAYPGSEQKLDFALALESIKQETSIRGLQEVMYNTFSCFSNVLRETDSIHQNDMILAIKQYIQDNLRKNITAKDIAAHVNLSESYITIYFKAKTGVNFRDYLLHQKMDYAKTLLRNPSSKVTEVAYLLGYQDYRSFSRAFKNCFNMSPAEFAEGLHE